MKQDGFKGKERGFLRKLSQQKSRREKGGFIWILAGAFHAVKRTNKRLFTV